MPIFEYLCRDCGHEFEAFVTSQRKAACPDCHGTNLGKLLSTPGFVGTGSDRSPSASPQGRCGAGGASCACRMNYEN